MYLALSKQKFIPMKKFLLLTSIAVFLFAGQTYAGKTGLFTYDKSVVETEMASLNELELYVLNHPGVSLSDMIAEGNPMVSDLSSPNNFNAFNLMFDKALGIGGFWWGCLLGPVHLVKPFQSQQQICHR